MAPFVMAVELTELSSGKGIMSSMLVELFISATEKKQCQVVIVLLTL